MTFKEWSYECQACGVRQKHFHWSTEAIPTCTCGGELAPASHVLHKNRGVVDDTVIGGRWCETIGHEPFFYTSKSELRREAARRGYENVVRNTDEYYAKHRKQHDERLRDERLR